MSSVTSSGTECDSSMLMLIMKIQPTFLLIFGFLANLCSFAVLIQPRLRRRPTFSYLAFLSLSNAFLSLIHAFFTIIGVHFGYTLEDLPLVLFCRVLNRFLIDFLTHFSLYTLTAVDLDRVRTVTSKTADHRRYSTAVHSRHNGCTKDFFRVCLIELLFACISLFFNLHWLTSYGYTIPAQYLNNTHDVTICTITDIDIYSPSYRYYLRTMLPLIELFVVGILPFVVSVFATIIILRHVSIKYTFMNSNHNKHLKQSRRRMELHLSILLISLNCVFILCTTPHNIYNVYILRLHRKLDYKHETEGELCSVATIQKSLDLLQQCYFMSTFFLYILTNKRFREEFYRLFQCFMFIIRRKKGTNNSPTQIPIHQHRKSTNESNHMNQNYLSIPPSPQVLDSRSSISDISQDDEGMPTTLTQ